MRYYGLEHDTMKAAVKPQQYGRINDDRAAFNIRTQP
jgi:hypothetical protein